MNDRDKERLALYPDLVHSLRSTSIALQEHLSQEAHRANITTTQLCPCQHDVDRAAAVLSRVRMTEGG